jgi:hypothetical protein
MCKSNVRSSADPGVGGGLLCCATDRMPNIYFGVVRADRLGDQSAVHIDGYLLASH